MTEIKIEKKQSIWPWVALIAGILALLYYLFIHDKADSDDDGVEMVSTGEVDTNDSTLSDDAGEKIALYQSYITDNEQMDIDHQYSSSALMKLIDATEAVANSVNVDINADLEAARTNASEIEKDPAKLNHADKIKSAGNSIVQALMKVQSQKFQDLDGDAKELQSSLDKIKPATPTLDQKDAIKTFFRESEELLTNMKNN